MQSPIDRAHIDTVAMSWLEEAKRMVECIGNRKEAHPAGNRVTSRSAHGGSNLRRNFQLGKCIL